MSNDMTAYVINTDVLKPLGRFATLADAEKFGESATDANFTIITDLEDCQSLLSRDEMVQIYNNVTGAELKKFSTKADGAQRLMDALDAMRPEEFAPPKKRRSKRSDAKSEKDKKAAGEGYKGHRAGSLKGQAHKLFDDKFGQEEVTRKEIIGAIAKLGVADCTAASWYQAFRRQALEERTPGHKRD